MSNKKHVILCSGAEITMAEMISIQELLQEVHGFANYHYPTNRSAKYLTVETKFHSDSRDNSVYNIEFSVTTNSGSVGRQLYVRAPKSTDMFNPYDSWVAECEKNGWTYEVFEGSVRDAIYTNFPESELKEKYRYCEAFLSRWCQYISGEATGTKELPEACKLYIADNFPSVPLDSEMYAMVGTSDQRRTANSFRHLDKWNEKGQLDKVPKDSDLDQITNIITGVKDKDGYMISEIHIRDGGLVFRGKIKSQFQFATILNALGLEYDW